MRELTSRKICRMSTIGCTRNVWAKGLCMRCYQQKRRHPDEEFRKWRRVSKNLNADGSAKTCTVEGCVYQMVVKEMCSFHYWAQKRKERKEMLAKSATASSLPHPER